MRSDRTAKNASPPAWTIIWPSRSARRMFAMSLNAGLRKSILMPQGRTAPAPDAATAAAVARAVPAPPGEPPVEMTRLADLTEGNPESMRELIDMFYNQTAQQLNQIEDAVRANKADDVGHVAHSCKGASATLGMTRLAAVLLKLEKLGKSGVLAGAEEFCAEARREFKDIRNFLAGHPALA